jgi:hypothetical protein
VMEMVVRSMETAETAMETDGDGFRGTSLSRQGAGTETSVPRNLSSTAAELRNYSGKNVDSFRVFRPEASYRRRGVVRSGPRPSHTLAAWPGPGPCRPSVRLACGPLLRLFRSLEASRKNKTLGTCFVQFQEYFLCSFSETQKQ